MTLLELISALKNKNISVKVVDKDTDAEIITFMSQGIAGVEGDVSARNVNKWEINGATAITVILETA